MKKSQQLVHFVSTGPKFPYYYYIGIMTALKVYGDKVRLWITEEPQSKYFPALKGKVKIIKIPARKIPNFPALRNKDDHFKRVAIFDYLIWRIVYKYGGIIMGLDSLTLRPHFDLLEAGKELMVPRYDETKPLRFTMHGVIVRKRSKLAKLIISDAKFSLNLPCMEWGYSGNLPLVNRAVQNLDKVSIAAVGLCADILNSSAGNVFRNDMLPYADVRTIPLYGSSIIGFGSKANLFDVVLDEEYIAIAQSYYARVVKEMLSEEEWNGPFRKNNKGGQ